MPFTAQRERTLYAKAGGPLTALPLVDGEYQRATMLYEDVERSEPKWLCVFHSALPEGEVVDLGHLHGGSAVVTWAEAQAQRVAA